MEKKKVIHVLHIYTLGIIHPSIHPSSHPTQTPENSRLYDTHVYGERNKQAFAPQGIPSSISHALTQYSPRAPKTVLGPRAGVSKCPLF